MAGYAIIPYYDGPVSTQEEMEIAYLIGVDYYTNGNDNYRLVKTNNLEVEIRIAAYLENNTRPYRRVYVANTNVSSPLRWIQIRKRADESYSAISNQTGISIAYNDYYYGTSGWSMSSIEPLIPAYDTLEEALEAMTTPIAKPVSIDYQGINTSFSGPETVDWGEEVSIDVTPGDGMVIQDPTQGKSISVYNENGYIPFVYANGKLTFTVPDAPNS